MTPHSKVFARTWVLAALLVAAACQRESGTEFDDSRLPSGSGGASGGGAKPTGGVAPSAGDTNGAQPSASGGEAASDGGSAAGAPDGEAGSNATAGSGGTGATGAAGSSGSSPGGTAGGGGVAGAAAGSGGNSGTGGKPADPDPVTVTISELADTYVASCAFQNFGSQKALLVDGDFTCRYVTLIAPELAVLPAGAEILSAQLELTCTNAGDAVGIAYAEGAWSESSVRWQDKPTASSTLTSFTCQEKGRLRVDVTALVAAWVSGEREAHGFYLESTGDDGTDFASSEAEDAAEHPALIVTYRPKA